MFTDDPLLHTTGDVLPKSSPQSERLEKHSSCSSSTASEPSIMEPRKYASQGNKNAAELKPVSLSLLLRHFTLHPSVYYKMIA
jgi:hypothetical protein